MYMQDADGFYPFALDAEDVQHPALWQFDAAFYASIPKMLLLQDALRPYTKSPQLFQCPSDRGYTISDFTGLDTDATPTSYEKFHTSYVYRTELAQRHLTEGAIVTPVEVNVLIDAVGIWHGSNFPSTRRYNVLFADGHVKNLDKDQVDGLWTFPIEARSSASF
jgi:prepilin-type processing-associated H-X9-DG protein